MQRVALWQVRGGSVKRIEASAIELEELLEDWIADDPSLVQPGLIIIGRQIGLESGKLDLLGLDPHGRWTIIEIKRGVLRRETIAQVLDYASSFSTLPADELQRKIEPYLKKHNLNLNDLLDERDALKALDPQERELALFIVGIGRAPGLERLRDFLADRYGVPLTVVCFDAFDLAEGEQILAREIWEAEHPPGPRVGITVHEVTVLAQDCGIGPIFRRFLEVAEEVGLYTRAWKTSVMFTPPENRTRMLFTVWAKPKKGLVKTYIGGEVFTEFYPTSQPQVQKYLGPEGWRLMTESEVDVFLRGLREFFAVIKTAERTEDQETQGTGDT